MWCTTLSLIDLIALLLIFIKDVELSCWRITLFLYIYLGIKAKTEKSRTIDTVCRIYRSYSVFAGKTRIGNRKKIGTGSKSGRGYFQPYWRISYIHRKIPKVFSEFVQTKLSIQPMAHCPLGHPPTPRVQRPTVHLHHRTLIPTRLPSPQTKVYIFVLSTNPGLHRKRNFSTEIFPKLI